MSKQALKQHIKRRMSAYQKDTADLYRAMERHNGQLINEQDHPKLWAEFWRKYGAYMQKYNRGQATKIDRVALLIALHQRRVKSPLTTDEQKQASKDFLAEAGY